MGNRTQDGLRFAGRRRWGHISLCTTIERSALAPFYSQLLANFTIDPQKEAIVG
ncbi:MAG: hypothetical protein WCF82_26135 [Microcoleus sp.]